MTDRSRSTGLVHDLMRMAAMNRRQLLRLGAGAVMASAVGCEGGAADTDGDGTGTGADASTGTSPTGGETCTVIPEETAGPFPGDGSNGVNALVLSGVVRSDIRASFAGVAGTAEGVLLTITLIVVDETCTPRAGHAVYLWHCDRDGAYSMYTGAAVAQNYLRGVQETDADGKATFVSIFPGAYDGRWPHMHFEVYPSLASATDAGNKLRTSQLALPEGACAEVFAVAGYEASVANLAMTSLDTDNVFSDGVSLQLPEIAGSVDDGYVATLMVTV